MEFHISSHSFAVSQLLDWRRADGADVQARMPLLSAYLGHVSPAGTYWYLTAVPELMELAAARLARGGTAVTALAPTLQAFFTERLIGQRGASGHTIAGYRDTWRMLLSFAAQHTGKNPSQLDIADLDAPLIAAFLDHLEQRRGSSPGPQTTGWRPSGPCSPGPRCGIPSTPPPSSGCWRSPPNGSSATWSPISPARRPTRWRRPATPGPGPAAATTQ